MPKWPIRVKLSVGLSLVVGMMLTLIGGSIYGLRAYHTSNLTLVDQMPELGASSELLEAVVRLDALRGETVEERWDLEQKAQEARKALATYAEVLKKNSAR